MNRRSVEELRNELERLMGEQLRALKRKPLGAHEQQLREQTERLKRIREVSADFLVALKKTAG